MRSLLLCLLLSASAAFVPSTASAIDDVDRMLNQGKIGDAIPAAEEAARSAPRDIDAQERWIDLMMSLGHPVIVGRHYQERVEAEPEDALAYYLLGRASITPEESMIAYRKAIALQPDFARAHMGMGAVHKALEQHEQAVAAYQKALDLDGTLGEAWGSLLSLYLDAGKREECLRLAELAMVKVPQLAEPYLIYAALNKELAEATLRRALKEVPPDARIWATLAELLLGQGKGDEALAAAKEAISLNATLSGPRIAELFAASMSEGTIDAAGYRALVDAHEQEKENPASVRGIYDEMVKRYPKSPLPWMSRARLRAADDPKGAGADLERALVLDPSNLEATAALGMLLSHHGPYDRAAHLLEQAARKRPYDASLQVAFAKAAIKSGRVDDALRRLGAASQLHPYHVDIALHYALAQSTKGDPEAAYQSLVAAMARNPDIRVIMARAAAAKESGRIAEALEIYDQLYARTQNDFFKKAAASIRAANP